MLLQFNFKNFKSFKEESTLDLTATKCSEMENHITLVGNEKILPVAGIFGANASGKSNVQEAFRYMCTYVMRSLHYADESDRSESEFMKPTPFLFSNDSRNESSLFEVYFIDEENKEKTYNYGFTVNQNGIEEEWLNFKSKSARSYKKIFYRCEDKLDLSGISEKSKTLLKNGLEKETLLVSLGAKVKVESLKRIKDWFTKNTFADFGQPIENLILSRLVPNDIVTNEETRKKIVNYFATFDSSIVGLNVEEIKDESANGKRSRLKIDACHKMIDSDELATIPLAQESAGTLKMFALYTRLQKVLTNGGVLFIDELNARLHPLLVRAFVTTFLDKEINTKHAQLIFTSHDSWQLNSNLLRRDEIWFAEKSAQGTSELFSLADFVDEDGSKIRKDENVEKNYLLGKYGAIPTLKSLDIF